MVHARQAFLCEIFVAQDCAYAMQRRTLQCWSATSSDEFGHPNLSGLAAGTSCGQFGPNFPAVPFWYSGKFGFQIRPQLGTDLRKVPQYKDLSASLRMGKLFTYF